MHPAPPALPAVLLALAVVGAAACGSAAPTAQPGVVHVVAAENFWGDIARQLGGAHASVTSIVDDPESDPHQFESDAHAAAAVADADVVVVNGAGYDDFVAKLLSSTSHAGRIVVKVSDVLHVTGGDANPHLWYDLPRIPDVARAIEAALVASDRSDRAAFAANLQSFAASLAPIDRTLRTIKTTFPGATVAYTERVPGYLLDAAGLTIVTPAGFARSIEDGNEPSAGDTKNMDDLVAGRHVRALLYNAQATSRATEHVRDLARRAGVPVVAVTETQPRAEPSYQSWQEHQLAALLTALGG